MHHTKAGPPMSAGGYNNHVRLLQAPGYVVIWTEQNHDARIVPLDGRPRIADPIRQWMGDSRGRWEGDTPGCRDRQLQRQGRRTRAPPTACTWWSASPAPPPTAVRYEYTVSDPETYTRPWTASIDLQPMHGDLYEFACHEGNYGMEGILAGARADERKAAAP